MRVCVRARGRRVCVCVCVRVFVFMCARARAPIVWKLLIRGKEGTHSMPVCRPKVTNIAFGCWNLPQCPCEKHLTLNQTLMRRSEWGVNGNHIIVRMRGQQKFRYRESMAHHIRH
ncbi:hypothetical protein EVAR_85695_1 [Eumeta japonica]|uniref:Uncharacterized protein n=1 Tax=Eumeta variegata TaxID=151549 RepID=A0A4C1WB13_EUMVA|nr:hypothetical protein EVAR_85695_1 [Eumeta japonica]